LRAMMRCVCGPALRHNSASAARRGALPWRRGACRAGTHDRPLTPVDYFRHRRPRATVASSQGRVKAPWCWPRAGARRSPRRFRRGPRFSQVVSERDASAGPCASATMPHAYDHRRKTNLRRSSACLASQSVRIPIPVDEFRHLPTAHQFLPEIADLPSLKQPLDPSRDFRCKSRVPPGWNANCPGVQPTMYTWHQPCALCQARNEVKTNESAAIANGAVASGCSPPHQNGGCTTGA
jgi:hypothetical protein